MGEGLSAVCEAPSSQRVMREDAPYAQRLIRRMQGPPRGMPFRVRAVALAAHETLGERLAAHVGERSPGAV